MATYLCSEFFIFLLGLLQVSCRYEPNWESLDSRPLPPWYDEAKIGIFLHWGVFSVPSFGEWFWERWKAGDKDYVDFMKKNYPPGFTYQNFGPKFTAEFYNPDDWAEIFEAAGAKYIVLTSKHHEGFTLWPSKYSWGWNAMDLGPGRDLLGDLANSIRTKTPDIHFGLYHSLYEWYNRLYLQDKKNNYKTNEFVSSKTMPELHELVNNYKPDVIWSDGDWEAYDIYWNSTGFLSWLFNDSPVQNTVVVNDRWGIDTTCRHGSFYTCTDRYNPGVLVSHKWENAMTLDRHGWAYNRMSASKDYLTINELLQTLAETVSCGGNLLVNAGPTPDGRIPPIMEERLRQMGSWLKVNGAAIYKSIPWTFQNDTYTPGVWFTSNIKEKAVYAIVTKWPEDQTLILGSVLVTKSSTVYMLGYSEQLLFKKISKGMSVAFPPMHLVASEWVWTIKMTGGAPRPQ